MREFESEKEALAAINEIIEEELNDLCVDNYRVALLDDPEAMAEYEEKKENGCCGFYDIEVLIAGERAMLGCNYGH